MQRRLLMRLWHVLGVLLIAVQLASCGGGGSGGGNASGDEIRVAGNFNPSELVLQGIEGIAYERPLSLIFAITQDANLFLVLEERNGVVADATGTTSGSSLSLTIKFANDLPPGMHTSELLLHACLDQACQREAAGSPLRVPIRFDVKPQIKIQAPAQMSRVGREAAPSQVLALDFRPEMGTPKLDYSGSTHAFEVALQGDRLVVNTRQLPAGEYLTRIVVTGSADPLYRAAVDVRYLVEAPPGGERPLSIDPPAFDIAMPQGTLTTRRFRIVRPTWTDALDPITISDTTVVKAVRALGNDEYEVTLDSRDVSTRSPDFSFSGTYFSSLSIRAGDTGGALGLQVRVSVDPPLTLGNPDLTWILTAASTTAELRRSGAVLAADGAAVRWSASADKPWVRLVRSNGTTGVDDLVVELDSSVADDPALIVDARLTLSLDRPGTLPFQVSVVVNNLVPRFDMASPGTIIGSTATVRIHGKVNHGGELLPAAGLLQVVGANLLSVRTEADFRFVGFVGVLAVDLGNVVPGQPVTIRVASQIRPTQVVVQAAAPPRLPTGYAVLPLGDYRPPSYGVDRRALSFAGVQTVWRWAWGLNGWAAPLGVPVPGVLDSALAPDESAVYATLDTQEVHAFGPDDLRLQRRGTLFSIFGTAPYIAFEPAPPKGAAALRFGDDGRAIVAAQWLSTPPLETLRGVGWLSGCVPGISADLAAGPCVADPGTLNFASTAPVGVALARSARGGAIAVTYSEGLSKIYRGLATQYVDGPTLPAGRRIVAVSDSGAWTVADDGRLRLGGSNASLNLAQAVPAGHAASGFGLAGSGDFALVYGFRLANEAAGPRARDAALYVVDLRPGASVLQGFPVAAAVVPLPDAVGCTTVLASGEACEHAANVSVAPGDASAFVLGPRGVAAVTLPQPVAAAAAATVRGRGLLRQLTGRAADR